MGMVGEHGYCPLTYNVCPGPDKCAPANLLADAQNKYRNPQEDAQVAAECPISALVGLTGALAGMMQVMSAGAPPGEAEKEFDEMSIKEQREHIIEGLGIDQL